MGNTNLAFSDFQEIELTKSLYIYIIIFFIFMPLICNVTVARLDQHTFYKCTRSPTTQHQQGLDCIFNAILLQKGKKKLTTLTLRGRLQFLASQSNPWAGRCLCFSLLQGQAVPPGSATRVQVGTAVLAVRCHHDAAGLGGGIPYFGGFRVSSHLLEL